MGAKAQLKFFHRRRIEGKKLDNTGERASQEVDGLSSWFSSLTEREVICWGFGCLDSQVDDLIWDVTEDDLRIKVKLKYGFEIAKSTQEFQILATVVSSALGGKPKKAEPPKNFKEAEIRFASVFGGKKSKK